MRRSTLLKAIALAAALFCAAPASAQQDAAWQEADSERGVDAIAPSSPTYVRHALVKATGRGQSAEEAERNALKAARALAATRYAEFGGPAALAEPGHERVVALHHSPPLGFADIAATALVEIRLRPQPEPLRPASPRSLPLPGLEVRLEQNAVTVSGLVPAEVLLAFAQPDGRLAGVLPGGGASWRLVPGKPLRQALLPVEPGGRLHVLACTGGIGPSASASNVAELLAKARAGKPRPALTQGVVSECVEAVLRLGAGSARGMRQKGSEPPVNMTGAAGRETGFPVPADKN